MAMSLIPLSGAALNGSVDREPMSVPHFHKRHCLSGSDDGCAATNYKLAHTKKYCNAYNPSTNKAQLLKNGETALNSI